MSPHRKHSRNNTKRLVLCGIFTAFSVIVMFGGSILSVATFTAPIFASLCLLPLLVELGPKSAFLAYIAVSFLSIILVSDREMVFLFIALIGYYPIIKPSIDKISFILLRYAVKLAIFNVSLVIVYTLLILVFTTPELRAELANSPLWMVAIMIVGGNFIFLMYDVLIERVKFIYISKFRDKLFK